MVAEKYIFNNHNKKYVNHKDGVKTNNSFSNLEWVTASENEKHSYNVLGKVNANRKLSDIAIHDIRSNCIKGVNVFEFITKYNVDRTTILNVINNKYYGA